MTANRQIRDVESRASAAAHAIGSTFANAALASRRGIDDAHRPGELEKAGALLLKDVAAVDHLSRRSFQRRNAEADRRARAYAPRGPGRPAMRDLLLLTANARREARLKGHAGKIPQATVLPLQVIPYELVSGRAVRSDARQGFETAAKLVLLRRAGATLTPAEAKRVERCWLAAVRCLPSADHLRRRDAERRAEHPQALGAASARARHRRASAREMDKLIRAAYKRAVS